MFLRWAARVINSVNRIRIWASKMSSILLSEPSRTRAWNCSLSKFHSLTPRSPDIHFARRLVSAALLIGAQCRNWCSMSKRVRRVVASPKTDNISAMALVAAAKTTMPWSEKSTVSIVSLHCSVPPNLCGKSVCAEVALETYSDRVFWRTTRERLMCSSRHRQK